MTISHRVPPGWRQIIIDLEAKVDVIDAYEDDWSGDLIVRALLDDMRDQRLVVEAAAKAAISCRECGKPGRLRGNRIVCRDHSPGDQETSIEDVVMSFSGFRHNRGVGDDNND